MYLQEERRRIMHNFSRYFDFYERRHQGMDGHRLNDLGQCSPVRPRLRCDSWSSIPVQACSRLGRCCVGEGLWTRRWVLSRPPHRQEQKRAAYGIGLGVTRHPRMGAAEELKVPLREPQWNE